MANETLIQDAIQQARSEFGFMTALQEVHIDLRVSRSFWRDFPVLRTPSPRTNSEVASDIAKAVRTDSTFEERLRAVGLDLQVSRTFWKRAR